MTEQEIVTALKKMESDPTLLTEPAFTSNTIEWPSNRMPFVTYHANYIRTHKLVRPEGYLSNLRLMLRIRAKQR
jgi:hypothetical protein